MFKPLDFIRQIFKGKTIYRILFNWQVREQCQNLSGEVLDLAGGDTPSYYNYLPKNLKINSTDLAKNGLENLDFDKDLPFADNSLKNVFLFNALYISEDSQKLLKEINRVLLPGGKLFLSSPFIAQEMPEPRDYQRLTFEGLERALILGGFSEIKIERFGERFSAAAFLLHDIWYLNLIRLFSYALSLLFDSFVPVKIKRIHPCPLGYFCVGLKK